MSRTFFLAALFLLGSGYVEEIEQHRQQIDRKFADPLTSPLAVFAIWRLDQDEMLIGRAAGSDVMLEDDSVELRHARIVPKEDESGQAAFEVYGMQGKVLSFPRSEDMDGQIWRVNQKLRIGRFLLVLQIHPAGPVVRAIDLESQAVKDFHGLAYFPVDPAFRIQGRIEPQTPLTAIRMIDTQGWQRPAWVYGQLHFEIGRQAQQLSLIVFDEHPAPGSNFMLIFRDATSGHQSYPACRYLYVPFREEGSVEVDFNRASNPFCAYADGFACPLPLPGNTLEVAIQAGEKSYH